MATQNARISLHFSDHFANKAVCTAYGTVDDSQTLAALQTDVATFASDVYAITDGQLVAAELITTAPTGGLSRGASTDSRAYETGVIRFSQVGTTASWSLAIPTLLDTVLTGKTLPLSQAGVAALLTAMASGITHITFSSPSGVVLGPAEKAFLAVRKHRKQLH